MTLLSRDEILGCTKLPTKDLYIKEWGGTVRIKAFTAASRGKFEEACSGNNQVNIRAHLAAAVIVDEKDNPMFTVTDINKLSKLSAKALDLVVNAAAELNGLGDDEVEALAKN